MLSWSLQSAAQQATLVADAHVSSARPSANSGSLSNLNVGGGYTALLQFDLGSLPASLTSSQVARATLHLYCNRADTPGSFTAALVTSPWSESVVTYATLPSTGSAVVSGTCSAADQFVTLDLTAAVQSWLTAPSSNFGLALTASSAVLQFDSKENDLTGHAPQLDITGTASTNAGVAGATGATGSTGATGAPGTQGLQGVAGPPGLQGPAGATGTAGATGATGSAGVTGATGIPGTSGIPGPTGSQGPAGPAGSGLSGTTGATGAAGPAGPVGATGATGSSGLVYQGTYSSTTNYTTGDVALFAGSSYVSLQTPNHGNAPGDSPLFWGALTAQGPVGAQGVAGAAGPIGPQGSPGSVGPPGERGDTGAQGTAGQAGAQGIPGVAGATGLQGPMGPSGPAGPVGLSFQGAYNSQTNYALADGVLWQGAGYVSLLPGNHGNTPSESPSAWALFAASGATGSAGATGPQGAAGATGVTGIGLPGATGATGAIGPQGASGLIFQGLYSSINSYNAGDAVTYNGSSYVSLVSNNHGNTPDQSPADWSVLAAQGIAGAAGAPGSTGIAGPAGATGTIGATGATGLQGPPVSFRGTWSSSLSYTVGDTVSYFGSAWIAIAANSNNQPGTSPASWSLLASIGAVGPAGSTGVQGPLGPQGIAGPQGPAGQAGAQGVQGITGAAGPQGPAGSTGAVGSVGLTFQGAYNSQTNYTLGDGVLWQGAGYVSLFAGNHGNTPDQSPSAWALFAAAGSTGATGAVGPAGPAGSTGATGIGLTGATGATGSVGAQGAAGLTFQGVYLPTTSYSIGDAVSYNNSSYVSLLANNHGNTPDLSPAYWSVLAGQGLTGPAGATGATGLTGLPGATGTTGATGAQGPPITFLGGWLTSNTYSLGATVSYLGSSYIAVAANTARQPDISPAYWSLLAAIGATGAAGPIGATGVQGLPGSVGPAGPQGSTGIQGSTGTQGVAGPTGPVGSLGPAGPTGSIGATGSIGPAGPSGSTGPQGPPVSFAGGWLTTQTYSVGNAVGYLGSSYIAIAANTGRQPDISPAYWSLLASAGSAGTAGPTGATGSVGPAGLPGAVGATGPQGAAGTAGVVGATGSTGSQGPSGTTGPPGATGSTGAAGLNGATGATGTTGTPGSPGAPGINFRSAWVANATYTINDAVTFAGSTYLSLAVNSNSEPDTSPQAWSLLAQSGALGPQGATGNAGTPGAAATISVAPVTVLPAGSQPTVTNTGTSSAAVLAFGLPAGGSGSSTPSTGSSNFAAMFHSVSYNTLYYSPNTPNASLNEATSVMTWVPRGCTVSRLDVYSQQSGTIKVTLRSGTPGNMADSALICNFAGLSSSSCSVTGSITISPGTFLDFRIDNASGTAAGVWTALECDQ